MKTSAFLVLAALAVAATLAVPSLLDPAPEPRSARAPETRARGILLDGEACSGAPCRIVVEPGLDTRIDRGIEQLISTTKTFTGGYRYWKEPVGRVLYVYDDVQNLVSRIVNPRSVRVVPATLTP